MGSCISKCKPKKTSNKKKQRQTQQQDECKCQCIEKDTITTIRSITPLVQDKLVISQAPPPPHSSPPKSSLSSAYSSCTTSNYPTTSSTSSTCSLSSSASSLASSSTIHSSKLDNSSCSSEFLWSCVKENPPLLSDDHRPIIKVLNPRRNSLPIKSQNNAKRPNRPKEFPAPGPQRLTQRSAPQKRPRCNSPSNLTRQKSFRREPEIEPNRPILRSGRDLRPMSPSTSRRFSGEGNTQGKSVTSSMRRENYYVRPQSPNKIYNNNNNNHSKNVRKYGGTNNLLVKRENNENMMIKKVSPKIEELGVGNLVSNQDVDMMPIEDVNNPHIALDCFIFL